MVLQQQQQQQQQQQKQQKQNKKPRGRKPKTSVDVNQGDAPSQAGQSNETKKGNLKNRKRGSDCDISTSTDKDSTRESVAGDSENEHLAEISFERLLQRIVKLIRQTRRKIKR